MNERKVNMNERKVNIGVFYGTLFSENLGCDALNYSFLQIMENIGKMRNEVYSYYFFWDIASSFNKDNLPIELKKYDINFIKVPVSLFRLLAKGILKDKMFSLKEYLEIIKKCDFFVDSCGGDSFSDIYGNYTLNYINKNHRIAKYFNKPIVMLPQTIGPFENKWAQKLAAKILDNAKHVFARDKISSDVVKKYIPNNKINQTVDMALFMEYFKINKTTNNNKIKVILAPSALLWNGGYTQNNQFCLVDNYQDVIRKIAMYLDSLEYVEVILLGHVLGGTIANPREDDFYLCKRLQYEYPNFKLAPYFYTPMEAKSFIANNDMLIASRMHCCIGAYSSGVPVLPLGYSRKFEGLFNETLNYKYAVDLRKDKIEIILNKLSFFIDSLDNIKKEVILGQEKLKEAKVEFEKQMLSLLKDIIL